MKSLNIGGWGVIVILGGTAWSQVTQRVNLSSGGAQTEVHTQDIFASIGSDGRFVAFDNPSGMLVLGDTNGARDVFVRDRLSGTTVRVSTGPSGVQGNGASGYPSISGDGRFVSFTSWATNLVPSDTNSAYDAFVHDRLLAITERVSISSSGTQGNGNSAGGAITPDGRHVVIVSVATNLVAIGTFGTHVFVRDRQMGTTELVSLSSGGTPGNNISTNGSISSDGRYVAFVSDAQFLVPGDTNDSQDVFVRDRQSGTTERVSVDSSGAEANTSLGANVTGSISASGRYVVFACNASNLDTGDTNGVGDVFVHDRQTGLTERVSVSSNGAQANLDCQNPQISADGRYVMFQSFSATLVSGDTNLASDVFVRDRVLGTTERVSVHSNGTQGNGSSGDEGLHASDDGRFVVFNSRATNLVPGDTNGRDDVFVRDPLGGPTFASLCSPGVGGVLTCPCANPPGGQGRGCENSSITGGAVLSAAGGTFLSSDSLVFTTRGEKPTALSIVLQGNVLISSGTVYGQGLRCVAGTLKRLYTKAAFGGSITAPDFGAGDPQVSVRSAALGDTIVAGQSRWCLVYYRDPIVLGGCPASSTFNATQTGQVTWAP